MSLHNKILAAIDQDPDKYILHRIYAGTVLPSVGLVLMGANNAARDWYSRTVKSCARRYGLL